MECCVAVHIFLVENTANMSRSKLGADVIQHLHEDTSVVLDRKQSEDCDAGHVLHIVVCAADRTCVRTHIVNQAF